MSNAPTAPLDPVLESQPHILGFDPGQQKCGVAIMDADRSIILHQVIKTEAVIDTLQSFCQTYPISLLVMGNQTTSKLWHQRLQEAFAPQVQIVQVDEHFSTLEARDRYWQMYPPQGLSRLIPQALRQIPRPIDDIVAIILIERHLKSS